MEPTDLHPHSRPIIPDLLVCSGLVVLDRPFIGAAAMTLPRHVSLPLSALAFASVLLMSVVINRVPHPLLEWVMLAVTVLMILFLALVAIRFQAWWELGAGIILVVAVSALALPRSGASPAGRNGNNR